MRELSHHAQARACLIALSLPTQPHYERNEANVEDEFAVVECAHKALLCLVFHFVSTCVRGAWRVDVCAGRGVSMCASSISIDEADVVDDWCQ